MSLTDLVERGQDSVSRFLTKDYHSVYYQSKYILISSMIQMILGTLLYMIKAHETISRIPNNDYLLYSAILSVFIASYNMTSPSRSRYVCMILLPFTIVSTVALIHETLNLRTESILQADKDSRLTQAKLLFCYPLIASNLVITQQTFAFFFFPPYAAAGERISGNIAF